MNSEKFIAEYNELKEKTKKYYNDVAKDIIEQLEETRLFYLFLSITLYIGLPLLIYLLFKIFLLPNYDDKFAISEIYFIYIVLIIVIYCIINRCIFSSYPTKIKIINNELLNIFNLKYFPGFYPGSVKSTIDNSELFLHSNRAEADDYFEGNYNNCNLKIAEIVLYKELNNTAEIQISGPSSPVFKGLAVTFDSNKKVKALTQIVPKFKNLFSPKIDSRIFLMFVGFGGFFLFGFSFLLMGLITKDEPLIGIGLPFTGFATLLLLILILVYFKTKPQKNKKFQKINIEDIEFSKHYDIYSYDQIESRYLITSAFIERFLFLQKVFKTRNICCAFVDDKILLLISSRKNLFEIGNLFTSLKNPKYVEKFYDEIIAILLLINHFKLNEHIS